MRNFINIIENAQGINDAWFADGFDTFKNPDKIEKYEIAQKPGELTHLENPDPVPYNSGDYIMTGPNNEQYVLSPAKFNSLKDDLGSGRCQPKKIPKVAKLADHDGFVTVDWGSGPQKLFYTAGNDYIVKHGPGDYGVVKTDIFAKTYDKSQEGK